MTADDVRARFEAEFRGNYDLQRDAAGTYLDNHTRHAWWGYRAAHADLAGEVRELVEDARWMLSQLPHNEFSHDFVKDEKRCDTCKRIKRIAAALAKLTNQETNNVLP